MRSVEEIGKLNEPSFRPLDPPPQIGELVRFIGSAKEDQFHGELCGKTGTVKQIDPWLGIDTGDGFLRDAGPSDGRYLERV